MKAAATRALHKKHAGTSKHVSKAKHTPTAHKKAATAHKQTARRTALTAKAAKARALSLGEGVACCSAEALAASLRLAGGAVSDDDVLALHWAAGGDEDTGVSILAALEAASVFGLAGYRLRWFGVAPFDAALPAVDDIHCRRVGQEVSAPQLELPGVGAEWREQVWQRAFERDGQPERLFDGHAAGCLLGDADCLPSPRAEAEGAHPGGQGFLLDASAATRGPDVRGQDVAVSGHALNSCMTHLILGVDLPGPHAVFAEPGRWWSWGERYDPASFPHARIEEAWAVSWVSFDLCSAAGTEDVPGAPRNKPGTAPVVTARAMAGRPWQRQGTSRAQAVTW